MSFKEIVENRLNEIGKDRKYLAELLNINYQTLSSKLNRNSFDDSDVFKIANKLNIDLNKIRDEIFFTEGVLGIWEEEDSNNCKALFINGDYCRKNNIDLFDSDKSLKLAIKCAIKDIFNYWQIDCDVDDVAIDKIKNHNLIFSTININNKNFCIAFSENSSFTTNKIVFSNECIMNI